MQFSQDRILALALVLLGVEARRSCVQNKFVRAIMHVKTAMIKTSHDAKVILPSQSSARAYVGKMWCM